MSNDVNSTLRRLPGIAVAIVALALSASLAFAGQPAGSTAGASNATHASAGVAADATDTPDATEAPEATDAPDATEAPDATDTPDTTDPSSPNQCTVDLTQDPSVLLTLNHGSVVCSAAQATSWDTTLYPTKGAWMSHWAKLNHGHDPNRTHGHAGG